MKVLRAGGVEDVSLGVCGIEAMRPQSLEVHRIYQNEIRVLGDAAGWYKIAYVTLRHVTDPIVDFSAHRFRIRLEVGLLQLIAEEVEHTIAQFPVIRYPQSVRAPELVIAGRVLKRKKLEMKKSFEFSLGRTRL